MQMPPAEPDWVRARADAPIFAVFRRLIAGAKKDVATRIALRRPGDAFTIEVIESSDECVVGRHDASGSTHVRFRKSGHGIEAAGEDFYLRGTLALDGQGQYRLHVNGLPTEEWYFRQMALEALLFGAPKSAQPFRTRAELAAAPAMLVSIPHSTTP